MKQTDRLGETHNRGFEDLKAWQLARQLMIECHKVAEQLPPWERYDLALQIRKSSKSGMANIAEGYGRYHYLDSLRFYFISRGSLNETINHVITAHDLGYVDGQCFQELYDLGREAERALNGYISYVWRQQQGHSHYGDRLVAEERAIYYTLASPELPDVPSDSTDAQPPL